MKIRYVVLVFVSMVVGLTLGRFQELANLSNADVTSKEQKQVFVECERKNIFAFFYMTKEFITNFTRSEQEDNEANIKEHNEKLAKQISDDIDEKMKKYYHYERAESGKESANE